MARQVQAQGASGKQLSSNDITDLRLKPEYKRCELCEVPLHVDGHEHVKWCSESHCPKQ